MNVQSCHLNLPFGDEEETVAMHNAAACLLPYLPALTASSPMYDGRLGPLVDLMVDGTNLLDRSYTEVAGVAMPGPTLTVSLAIGR